jgi:hypothetical protein
MLHHANARECALSRADFLISGEFERDGFSPIDVKQHQIGEFAPAN